MKISLIHPIKQHNFFAAGISSKRMMPFISILHKFLRVDCMKADREQSTMILKIPNDFPCQVLEDQVASYMTLLEHLDWSRVEFFERLRSLII